MSPPAASVGVSRSRRAMLAPPRLLGLRCSRPHTPAGSAASQGHATREELRLRSTRLRGLNDERRPCAGTPPIRGSGTSLREESYRAAWLMLQSSVHQGPMQTGRPGPGSLPQRGCRGLRPRRPSVPSQARRAEALRRGLLPREGRQGGDSRDRPYGPGGHVATPQQRGRRALSGRRDEPDRSEHVSLDDRPYGRPLSWWMLTAVHGWTPASANGTSGSCYPSWRLPGCGVSPAAALTGDQCGSVAVGADAGRRRPRPAAFDEPAGRARPNLRLRAKKARPREPARGEMGQFGPSPKVHRATLAHHRPVAQWYPSVMRKHHDLGAA